MDAGPLWCGHKLEMHVLHVYHSPTLGAHTHAHPCPWVLGGQGCDIIGNVIGNVTIPEYMGTV